MTREDAPGAGDAGTDTDTHDGDGADGDDATDTSAGDGVDGPGTRHDGAADAREADDEGEPVATPPVLCDVMLGKLATYLRMCGYDAAYALDRGVEDDDEVRALAAAEGRRLLTRDEALAARTDGATLVEARDPVAQVAELRRAGYPVDIDGPPSRCGACNGVLEPAGEPTPPDVPEDVRAFRCRDCGKHFWRGSHWADLRERLGAGTVD